MHNIVVKLTKTRSGAHKHHACGNRLRRKGATTVEFALVIPVLITMLFICFEFTRLCMMTNLAQDAAYEAARYAMVEGATAQDAKDRANHVLARLGTQNATVIVNNDEELSDQTASVTVRVTVPMADNSFVLSHFTTDHVITAEISLTAERYKGFYSSE